MNQASSLPRMWMAIFIAIACNAAGAQQPPNPNAGKTAYYCDRNGSISWQVEPCAAGQRELRTGRVRDDGTIDDGSAPPPAAPTQAAPAPAPVAVRAAAPSQVETHRLGYIKNPWAWLLGFALAFGVFGKLLGRPFYRWAIGGALTEFILVGLDLMPFK